MISPQSQAMPPPPPSAPLPMQIYSQNPAHLIQGQVVATHEWVNQTSFSRSMLIVYNHLTS